MKRHLEIPLKHYPERVDSRSHLYIHTTLDKLMGFAAAQSNPLIEGINYTQLWANLMFNYYGKWCLNDKGERIQITKTELEQVFHKKFPGQEIPNIDPEEILEAKFLHILGKERLLFRGMNVNENGEFYTKDLDFNTDQIKDPETQFRLAREKKNAQFDFSKKYNPLTQEWSSHSVDFSKKGQPKPGTLHTKKRPATLFPSNFNNMEVFEGINQGVGFIFDVDEVDLRQEKYIFKENAFTNLKWWYHNNKKTTSTDHKKESIGLKKLKEYNSSLQAAPKLNNEVLIGMPKKCLRGIVVPQNEPLVRLRSLVSMHYVKSKLELDMDLPIFIKDKNNKQQGIVKYTHEQRLKDIFEVLKNHENEKSDLKEIHDFLVKKPTLLLSMLQSSWQKCENEALKKDILTKIKAINFNKDVNYEEELEKSPVSKNDISSPAHITPYTFKIENNTSQDKALFAVAMVTVLPLAGVGLYRMIDELMNIPDSTFTKIFKGVGITIAALTVVPAIGYGLHCAIKTLSYEEPNMSIQAEKEKIPLNLPSPPTLK